MYEFSDTNFRRDLIFKKAKDAFKSVGKLEGTKYDIEFSDLKVPERKFGKKEQKEHLLKNTKLTLPLQGKVTMKDKSGNIVDKKELTLAQIPYMTERGTFISGGNEYATINQFRLKPGVYTRQKSNELLESHFNVDSSSDSPSFRIFMEPESGLFKLNIGQSKKNLYPLLKHAGVGDATLENKWGKELLQANKNAYRGIREVTDIYAKLHKRNVNKDLSPEEKAKAIFDKFSLGKLDPEVTKVTLGKPYSEANIDAIMDASKKLLKVHKGEEDFDDRDSLKFRSIHSIEDFIEERILKDSGNLQRKLLNKSTYDGSLRSLKSGYFTKPIDSLITQDSRSRPIEQNNPIQIFEHFNKVTSLGEGGIGSSASVPDETRQVHSSQFGFVDPVRSPESSSAGVDLHLTSGIKRDGSNNLYTRVLDKANKEKWITPEQFDKAVVMFPGETGRNVMVSDKNNKIREVHNSKVEYKMEHASDMFDNLSNLVPMIGSVQGNRLLMGSKMLAQAFPLLNPEAPLVQSLNEKGGGSFEELAGKEATGVVKAEEDGEVYKVSKDFIALKTKSGVKKYDLYNNFPFNRKTYFDNNLQVKKGDKVKKGAILATSNYTDDKGVLALGKDLHVGYLPYKGYNHEDGIVISESAAKKLTSDHMYSIEKEKSKQNSINKNKYVSLFPGNFTLNQLDIIDKDGVVKPGTILQPNDPLILNSKVREFSTTDVQFGKLHSILKEPYMEDSVVWDEDYNGEVIDVQKTNSGIKVNVKIQKPTVVADKLCFDKETEVLTENGWKFFKDLSYEDKVATLNPETNNLEYETPTNIYSYDYDGKMYFLKNDKIDILVTPNHKHYVAKPDSDKFEFETSTSLFGNLRKFLIGEEDPSLGFVFHLCFVIHKEEWINYKDKIYSCEVSSHIIYVRRNGSSYFSGNSNRYGGKGVVSLIVPDDRMPKVKETGEPLEILLTPAGVPSRINPAQITETLLGKIAHKKGMTYKVPLFTQENMVEFAEKELKKHEVKDTEDLIDPITSKVIPGVMVGRQRFNKLFKTAESGFSARSAGPGEEYTSELKPARGATGAAKRISNLQLNALLSHGAVNNLREISNLKGNKNDEYWKAMKLGLPLPTPDDPFIYTKFLDTLQASGINVVKDNQGINLMPLTDYEITKMSNGAVENYKMLKSRDLKPERHGLFDPVRTGGAQGKKWTHIDLEEPIPNPIMESPIKFVLGMNQKTFDKTLEEKGGAYIKKQLSKIDVGEEIINQKKIIKEGNKSVRDKAVKTLGYLKALKKNNIEFKDLMLTKLPVLPPIYRPITVIGGNASLVDDANNLYKDVIQANESFKLLKHELPGEELAEERANLYNSAKAVVGLGEPVNYKYKQKGLKGFIAKIAGTSPKVGMFHSKVIGKTQDLSGRGIVIPDPTLPMDTIGMPEDMAWKLYKPFVMRKLVTSGYSAIKASELIENRDKTAERVLDQEMSQRPSIINRSPTLHKFNMLSLFPIRTKGNNIKVPPLIEEGFNMDYDGDSVSIYTPVSEAARKESIEKMLPSQNLMHIGRSSVVHKPSHEAVYGLYEATKSKKGKVKKFKNKEAAIAAYHRGEIELDDPIEI